MTSKFCKWSVRRFLYQRFKYRIFFLNETDSDKNSYTWPTLFNCQLEQSFWIFKFRTARGGQIKINCSISLMLFLEVLCVGWHEWMKYLFHFLYHLTYLKLSLQVLNKYLCLCVTILWQNRWFNGNRLGKIYSGIQRG